MINPSTISEAVYCLFIATQRSDREAQDIMGDILEMMLDRKLTAGERERATNEFMALFITEE